MNCPTCLQRIKPFRQYRCGCELIRPSNWPKDAGGLWILCQKHGGYIERSAMTGKAAG